MGGGLRGRAPWPHPRAATELLKGIETCCTGNHLKWQNAALYTVEKYSEIPLIKKKENSKDY